MRISFGNKVARLIWGVTWAIFGRPTPRVGLGFKWRRLLCRAFGAKLARGVRIYPRATIWAPWNLTMGEASCLADGVDCYSVDRVTLGANVVVSQGAYLCTASHDITKPSFDLITRPIAIGDRAWVAAKATVLPGVRIGEGAVVGATATVVKDVAAWTVVGGNPAKFLKKRMSCS